LLGVRKASRRPLLASPVVKHRSFSLGRVCCETKAAQILAFFNTKSSQPKPGTDQNIASILEDLFKPDVKEDKGNDLRHGNMEDFKASILPTLSESLLQTDTRKHLRDLEHWKLYPKQIKKWLIMTKTRPGFYDGSGMWVELNIEDSDFSGDFDTEQTLNKFREMYIEEQSRLPADLRGRFRFGVTWEEIKDFHPKILRLFSFTFAKDSEKLAVRKQLAIQKWKQHENDTASDAIQIDILTQRIRSLSKHLQTNRQDKHNERNLGKLLKRRKGLMKHLKKEDVHLYFEVLREIKLRDMYELYH